MNLNIVGTAGGVGTSVLAAGLAHHLNGTVFERGVSGPSPLARLLNVPHDPSLGVFVHGFGDEAHHVGDCGQVMPVAVRSWHTVLLISRRYGSVAQAGTLLAADHGHVVGWVDAATPFDTLALSDLREAFGGYAVPHLGTLTHSASVSRTVDAGLLTARWPRSLASDVQHIATALGVEAPTPAEATDA